jgi:DNA replication protein DnaC
MGTQQDYKNPLISIPQKKLDQAIQTVIDSFKSDAGKQVDGGLSSECSLMVEAIHRYAAANIPVDYWFRDMANFNGDKGLLNCYKQITMDISKAYNKGIKLCFAGNYGVGKTMVCSCILKKAVEKGYSALYVTLTDIVTLMASHDVEGKYAARQILLTTDFLVIDEFDPRFMGTDNASDLYGRILEPTLRTRIQNTLPVLLCTNSPNVLSSFSGALKQSISSLMGLVRTVPVLGNDYRTVVASEDKNG